MTAAFAIQPDGNFESRIVLQRQHPGPLAAEVETALAQLFRVRYGALPEAVPSVVPARDNQAAKTHPWPGRIPPVTDTKMIVAWNSLMISGLATAAAVLAQPEYLALATAAAEFIEQHQWVGGRFQRLNYDLIATIPAQSEDYALFIKALIDLHQAHLCLGDMVNADRWLSLAQALQQEFDEHLWAIEGGGYFNTATDADSNLLIRERSWLDNATPAANGVAIANLIKLALLTTDLGYLDRAEQALHTFGGVIQNSPTACPSLLMGLDWYANHLLLRTTPDHLPRVYRQQYSPTTVYARVNDLPPEHVGLVCEGLTCQAPAQNWNQLQEQVNQGQIRSLGTC
jgi:hypothetical protein